MNKQTRAVLFANGEAGSPERFCLQDGDFLVAVDGGLHNLKRINVTPDLLIGDLDSVSAGEVQTCREESVEVLQFPTAKDQTDLELALDEVLARGYRKIVIAFGLGGRLDHQLANLALLARPDLTDYEVSFDDGVCQVFLVRDRLNLATLPGEIISLLPWGGAAEGVRTEGLAYPLCGETLLAHQARGVSNVALGERCSVSLEKGSLLLIRQQHQTAGKEKEK